MLKTLERRWQQRQRRIYERTGEHVALFRIRRWDEPDYLEHRARWRAQGLALVKRATCVGGKLERFLAP